MLPLRPRPVWALARTAAELAAPSLPGLRGLRNSTMLALGAGAIGLFGLGLLLQQAGLPGVALAQALLLYGLVGTAVLLGLARHLPHRRFGTANAITLARAVLVCLLSGLLGWADPRDLGWLPLAAALGALCLDGLDGWAARRSGSASAFGARFDMEVDGLFLIVLCALLIAADKAGPWVLAAALPRYLFVAAGRILPWLRRELPPGLWRKVAFVAAAMLLLFCLAPPLDPPLSTACAAVAVALIAASFTRDLVWLHRRRGDSP